MSVFEAPGALTEISGILCDDLNENENCLHKWILQDAAPSLLGLQVSQICSKQLSQHRTHLKPLETASRLWPPTTIAQFKVIEVALPIRPIWCNPLQHQEEQRRHCERLVYLTNWLDVYVVQSESKSQKVENRVHDWKIGDAQNLTLLLRHSEAVDMSPAEKYTADYSYNRTSRGDVDHELMEIDAAIAEKRRTSPYFVRSRSWAFDVVGARKSYVSQRKPGGINGCRRHVWWNDRKHLRSMEMGRDIGYRRERAMVVLSSKRKMPYENNVDEEMSADLKLQRERSHIYQPHHR